MEDGARIKLITVCGTATSITVDNRSNRSLPKKNGAPLSPTLRTNTPLSPTAPRFDLRPAADSTCDLRFRIDRLLVGTREGNKRHRRVDLLARSIADTSAITTATKDYCTLRVRVCTEQHHERR
jgi:hypothetical protein